MLLDIDWLDFIARLDTWEGLRPRSRRALISIESGGEGRAGDFGADLDVLTREKFLETSVAGRVRLVRRALGFGRALRFMSRHPLLESHEPEALLEYLRELLDARERNAVMPGGPRYWGVDVELSREAASVSWPRSFAGDDVRGRLRGTPGVDRAQRLVRSFLDGPGPEPVPFRDLTNRFPDIDEKDLPAALTCALTHLVVFPVLLEGDAVPALTLWPPVARRYLGPPPPPPGPMEPAHTFDGAPLLEDMTTLLLAAAAEPLPVRQNDLALYARAARRIEADLMPLPDWLEDATGMDSELRLELARDLLWRLNLTAMGSDARGRLVLSAAPGADDWLARSAAERLRAVLDHLRAAAGFGEDAAASRDGGDASADLDPDDEDLDFDDPAWELHAYQASWQGELTGRRSSFLPPHGAAGYLAGDARALAAAVRDAFRELPEGRFFALPELLDHRVRRSHPIADRGPVHLSGYWRVGEEEKENLWKTLLGEFVLERLVALGCARAGLGQDRFCFALTPAGRYLLGLTDDFEHPVGGAEGAVVVQPDLEVVFLAPAPGAEAAIGRFAQRVGHGLGTLFRLTPEAAYGAAAGGLTADRALEALRAPSARPVPPNVERELRGWFERCRRVRARQAVLVECPDPETAARVVSAGGRDVTMLSETVLRVGDRKALGRLRKRLAAKGVFVDEDGARSR